MIRRLGAFVRDHGAAGLVVLAGPVLLGALFVQIQLRGLGFGS